jgi:methylase of polypeptide subunit release factors
MDVQAEVGRDEPSSALDGGGAFGLECLVEICAQAADFLRTVEFLGMETGGELRVGYKGLSERSKCCHIGC